MRPSDVITSLKALIPTRRPTYLWGPPGCSKSSIVKQTATELGLQLIDVRATLLDPVDLRGLPKVSGKTTTWCPPDFLPKTGTGVLFLDELAQAVPNVQTALFQLTLDRRIGEYELPEGWSVVAASNRAQDKAGTHRVVSALLNRFIHVEVDVNHEDWQHWAVTNGIREEVRAFIRFKSKLLWDESFSQSNDRAFATPRSWQFVSDILPTTPPHLLQQLVAGCVGEGAAAEFKGYLELCKNLPDIDSVLAQPTSAQIPAEPAVLYAVISSLVERVRTKPALAGNFARYGMRLPDEFAMLALKDALAIDNLPGNGGKLRTDPEMIKWVTNARSKGLYDKSK